MRDAITTVVEVAGAALVTAGVGLVLGLGAALIVAGIACLAFGYLAGK